jgi:hypothetical protein
MSVDLLDECANDPETLLVVWLAPLYAVGHVANERPSGGPLPFVLVNHLSSNETVEESISDALVSVHVLTHKSAGNAASRDESLRVHRRIMLLSRYLDDLGEIVMDDGRTATIDFVSGGPPVRAEYGDDLILRRVGRYQLGLSYAPVA